MAHISMANKGPACEKAVRHVSQPATAPGLGGARMVGQEFDVCPEGPSAPARVRKIKSCRESE